MVFPDSILNRYKFNVICELQGDLINYLSCILLINMHVTFNYLKKIIKLGLQTIHKSGPLKVCHSGTNLIALLFLLLGDGKETHFQDVIEDRSSVDLR